MFLYHLSGYLLEERLKLVESLSYIPNFSWPTMMLEDQGIVSSYVMPYFSEIDFTNYYENVTDLKSYANIHSKIEKILY